MRITPLFLYLFLGACAPADASHDVVIYGGTSSGVVAAIAASQQGLRVALIEPTQHLGGLSSSGLGATDIGNKAAIGGLAREFYRRVGARYGQAEAWRFEPHVAESVFDMWLAEHDVEVHRGVRLDRTPAGVEMEQRRIVAIVTESGARFAARQFIDATYEGDLMAAAGVSYVVGRESNDRYDETLNGVQVAHAVYHQFSHPVDPYVIEGDPNSGLLPGIGDGPGNDGEGDHRVQAYCFRICATTDPDNRRPWPRPDDYDPALYELLLRSFDAGDRRIPWHPVPMPNSKTDSNNNFGVSTDYIGANYDYPEGSYATRDAITQAHRSYQQGLFWTLANDARVPPEVQAEFHRYGLARDEFTDNDNWPHLLYIREARRMVGEYVMTQHDCQGRRRAEDVVGLAAYTMDSHHVQRYVDASGHVRNEGDVQVGGFPPYPISLRAIRPDRSECVNLTVPVCLSASHIAFGSIRMEPVFMVLGHSAAVAAALAIEGDLALADIDYGKLRERLLDEGQVLSWQPRGTIAKETPDGVIVDDEDATFEGPWPHSTSTAGFVGDGYHHDDQTPGAVATFEVGVDEPGRYELRLHYPAHENRSSAVAVTVHHRDGVTTLFVDQRRFPSGGDDTLLGRFHLNADARVTLRGAPGAGYVVADAIQLLRETR